MVRDFDVNSVQLEVSQKSVLQQMLSQSLYISLFESFAGIAMQECSGKWLVPLPAFTAVLLVIYQLARIWVPQLDELRARLAATRLLQF